MNCFLSLTLEEITRLISEWNYPAYRAGQIFQWLHQKRVVHFDDMSNLPKDLREKLKEFYYISNMKILERFISIDGSTSKYLATFGNDSVEFVRMEYKYGSSVCISTQAGCRMGCKFCATAETGFSRNLTTGEMCTQVYNVGEQPIRNVVLMGCGEPLDNFEEVVRFIQIISHPKGYNLGQRHISLSTCGLVPQIYKLADLKLQITLAISLHAPTDVLRQAIMPITNQYPLKELIKACEYYAQQTHRRITFEYALARGVNDNLAHAKTLAKLLQGISLCHVNLIPMNKARETFSPSSKKDIEVFAEVLQQMKITTTVRRSLGGDVLAACGQLRANAPIN